MWWEQNKSFISLFSRVFLLKILFIIHLLMFPFSIVMLKSSRYGVGYFSKFLGACLHSLPYAIASRRRISVFLFAKSGWSRCLWLIDVLRALTASFIFKPRGHSYFFRFSIQSKEEMLRKTCASHIRCNIVISREERVCAFIRKQDMDMCADWCLRRQRR